MEPIDQIDRPTFSKLLGSGSVAGYPHPITALVSPVIRSGADEVAGMESFGAAHPAISRCRHIVLLECAPKIGQSFVKPAYVLEASRALVARRDDVCVLLSSNLAIGTGDERLIDASRVTFRGNAELTKHCMLLVGCSSGISWLATSAWDRLPPMIQLLKGSSPRPNSLLHNHERQSLPTSHLIEMIDCQVSRVVDCLCSVIVARGSLTG